MIVDQVHRHTSKLPCNWSQKFFGGFIRREMVGVIINKAMKHYTVINGLWEILKVPALDKISKQVSNYHAGIVLTEVKMGEVVHLLVGPFV